MPLPLMKKQGRPRLPRYVLSTECDGKRMFLCQIQNLRSFGATVTSHTSDIGMAMFFTKYKADKLRMELSSNTREYEVEPLHLN